MKTKLLIILALSLMGLLAFNLPPVIYELISPKKALKIETLRLRITKYIPPALELIKQTPLFGTGLWSYRNKVYDAQARLNERDPSFFADYGNPKPRRVHNDYVEILVDGGLVAGVVLLVFMGLTLKRGIENNDVVPVCSLVAILVTALFFFPFRLNITLFMTVIMMGMIWIERRESWIK